MGEVGTTIAKYCMIGYVLAVVLGAWAYTAVHIMRGDWQKIPVVGYEAYYYDFQR